MGYTITWSASEKPIRHFLHTQKINILQFQVHEFLLRKFVSELDSALVFPDFRGDREERFNYGCYFEDFQKTSGYEWGLHSLALTSVQPQVDIKKLADSLQNLHETIPRDSRNKIFKKLSLKVEELAEEMFLLAREINHEIDNSKAWAEKTFLYLSCSKLAAGTLLGIHEVDKFMSIKYELYFPDHPPLTASEIREKTRHLIQKYQLENKFNAFITFNHAEEVVSRYQRKWGRSA